MFLRRVLIPLVLAGLLAGALGASGAAAETLFVLRENQTIQRVDSSAPGTMLGTTFPLQLTKNEVPVGLDYRPQDGRMYLLSYDTATTKAEAEADPTLQETPPDHLYLRLVDPTTGMVSARTDLGKLEDGSGENSAPHRIEAGGAFGDDFDPDNNGDLYVMANGAGLTPSRLFRVNMATLAMTRVGTGPGDNAYYPALAFDHDRASDPATSTAFTFDQATGALGTISPATGLYTPIGATGAAVEPGEAAGIELDTSPFSATTYLAAGVGSEFEATLFTVDTGTGAATQVGKFSPAKGNRVLAIAARPNGVRMLVSNATFSESEGVIALTVKRQDPVGESVVHWVTSPSSPALGHYDETEGDITFSEGSTTQTIEIPIPQNGVADTEETVAVYLAPAASPPDGAAITLSPSSTLVTVENNLPASSPIAAIQSPAAGGTYALGALAPTRFSCAEGLRGPGLTSCLDSIGQSGGSSHLDTSSAGPHVYQVTATSGDGKIGIASIAYTVKAPPAAPSLSGPKSPSRSATPLLHGNAEAGTTVTIHLGSCSGEVLASAPASTLNADGIQVTVLRNRPVSLFADATDSLGQVSDCSNRVAYTNDTIAPRTEIVRHPAPRTASRRARFSFGPSHSTFRCKLDSGSWRPCRASSSFSVAPGSHKLRVRATDAAGNADRTPARFSWRVLR